MSGIHNLDHTSDNELLDRLFTLPFLQLFQPLKVRIQHRHLIILLVGYIKKRGVLNLLGIIFTIPSVGTNSSNMTISINKNKKFVKTLTQPFKVDQDPILQPLKVDQNPIVHNNLTNYWLSGEAYILFGRQQDLCHSTAN